jgi:hypothetical protein
MTTYINSGNIEQTTIDDLSGPKITSITVTNSSYVATGATTVSTSGGYVQIVGTSFSSPMQVFLDPTGTNKILSITAATAVAYVSSTTINVQLPAKAAGNYTCFVVRTSDGQFASKINGIRYA